MLIPSLPRSFAVVYFFQGPLIMTNNRRNTILSQSKHPDTRSSGVFPKSTTHLLISLVYFDRDWDLDPVKHEGYERSLKPAHKGSVITIS